MITLLRDDDVGFPDPYLVARIRGRREVRLAGMHGRQSALLAVSALADEGAIDREHETEVRWLYRQTTGKTREGVAPLFVLFELRRLITWLRQATEVGARERLNVDPFAHTLWHQALLREWSNNGAAAEVLGRLEKRVAARVPAFKGVSRDYQGHNLTAAEHRMTGAILAHVATRGATPLFRDHCRRLIDLCNVSALAKAWLWKLPALPPSIPAGHLNPAQLDRIWREGDVERVGLPAAASKATITAQQIATLQEEKKKTIWRSVRQQARESDPQAMILDYLYFLEAEAVHRRDRLPIQPTGIP